MSPTASNAIRQINLHETDILLSDEETPYHECANKKCQAECEDTYDFRETGLCPACNEREWRKSQMDLPSSYRTIAN